MEDEDRLIMASPSALECSGLLIGTLDLGKTRLEGSVGGRGPRLRTLSTSDEGQGGYEGEQLAMAH
jgi:hypothetical protein